jgi:VCBS repeat-containing protein
LAIDCPLPFTMIYQPPSANPDTGTATEAGGVNDTVPGSNATGKVLTNDSDPNLGGTLSVSAVAFGNNSGNLGQPLVGAYGTITLNANGSYSYVVDNTNATVQKLNVGQTLTETFSYTAKDSVSNLTASSTLTITINGADDAPTLTSPATTLTSGAEDTVYTINQAYLLVGFTDVEVSDLSVSGLAATNGILTNNGDGTSTFAPNVNYNGLVELSYNVIDGNGGSTNATQSFTIAEAPAIKHAGDFDGDGKSEILWRNNDGSVAIWQLDGTSDFTITSAPIIGSTASAPKDWKIADTGDFDGDGKSEILWRNNDGSVAIWKLDGTSDFTIDTAPIIGSAASAPTDWKISGTGDFDGDGKSEILWYNNNDHRVAIWKLDGTSDFTLDTAPIVGIAPANSKIKSIDDLDGDGKSEIVWRNNDGSVAIWKLDGTSAFTLASDSVIASAIKAPTDWRTSATGDFNGNGTSEILWRNTSGAVAVWELDGTSSFTPVVAPIIANAASAPNVWGIAAPI